MASGGGGANARGLRFQNLCALDYALRELESGNSRITAISVESRTCPSTGRVFQELDFSLLTDEVSVVDAQVKSGSSAYSLPEAWRELWQLTDREVEAYLLVTNRRPARAVQRLAELLATHCGSFPEFVGALTELCAGVRASGVQIASASQDRLERLKRTRLVLSSQDVDSLQDALRDRIRELRRRYRKGTGTRSTGLVFRNVLDLIADRAGNPHDVVLSLDELGCEIGADERTVAEALNERDWDVHAGLAPVVPDIARTELLESICSALVSNSGHPGIPCCVLFGLSGVGKTSLAAGWAVDHAYEFDRVFWVTAQDAVGLRKSFAAIEEALLQWTGQVRLQKPQSNRHEDVRQRVHRLLSSCPGPWLIVFDNAIDAKVVQPWIPRRGWGRVLVTTIVQGCWHGNGIATIEVPPMQRGQAIDLLSMRLSRGPDEPTPAEREQLGRLAEFMCDWPLGLELAAAYLSSTDVGLGGIDSYTVEVRQRSLADSGRSPHGYNGSLVSAIELAADRMKDFPRGELAPAPEAIAETMIYLAAYLDERQIPLQLLIVAALHDAVGTAGADAGLLRRWPVEPFTTHGEILRSLVRLSLVRRDRDLEWLSDSESSASAVSVHMNRIVQQTLRERIRRFEPTQDQRLFRQLTHHIAQWLQYSEENHETMRAGVLLDHALAVSRLAGERGVEDEYVSKLCQNIGVSASTAGNSNTSKRHFRKALALMKSSSSAKNRIKRFILHIELAEELISSGSRHSWNEESCQHIAAAAAEIDAVADLNPQLAATFAATMLTYPTMRLGIDRPEVVTVSEKLARFADQAEDGANFFETPDVPYEDALRRGDFRSAADVCEQALRRSSDPRKEQRLICMAVLPLERVAAWDRIVPLMDRLVVKHVRRNRLYSSTGLELMRSFGPVCAAQSLMQGADPNIATALGSLSAMVPFLRQQAHGEVKLDFLTVIEATHAVVRGDFDQAGDLIATVPEGFYPDPVESAVWDFLRSHIINLVRTCGPHKHGPSA